MEKELNMKELGIHVINENTIYYIRNFFIHNVIKGNMRLKGSGSLLTSKEIIIPESLNIAVTV